MLLPPHRHEQEAPEGTSVAPFEVVGVDEVEGRVTVPQRNGRLMVGWPQWPAGVVRPLKSRNGGGSGGASIK